MPELTVIVPAFNHAPFVEQTLDSVASQGLDSVELVICDDASTDDSAAVIRRWAEACPLPTTLVLHEQNRGLPATLNEALSLSTGDFVVMISGDDYYLPGGLARLLDVMRAQPPEVAVTYADARQVAVDGSVVTARHFEDVSAWATIADGWAFDAIHRGCYLSVMATMIRRSALEEVGGFDETLPFEDWDMWLRLADRYEFRVVDEAIADRRLLDSSLFHSAFSTPPYQRAIVRMMDGWIDRDEVARRHSAFWIRRAARVIATEDRDEARALLKRVADVPRIPDDRYPWAALTTALAVPGSGRALPAVSASRRRARLALEAERGAWRSGRRLPFVAGS